MDAFVPTTAEGKADHLPIIVPMFPSHIRAAPKCGRDCYDSKHKVLKYSKHKTRPGVKGYNLKHYTSYTDNNEDILGI